MEAEYPQYQFVGEMGMTLFDEAYVTKDADEIARIRSVAARTSAVWQATWDFIAAHRAEGETVVKDDGSPLTIGDVKRFVRRELLDRDLEDDAMIFAQGRDGGFPHSRGEAEHAAQAGSADCLRPVPARTGRRLLPRQHPHLVDWLRHAGSRAGVSAGHGRFRRGGRQLPRQHARAKVLQEAVQDYFESKGHPTTRSNPATSVGYVHSLGHGVGLNIHERPSIGHLSKDTLQPGNVISIEPGLYYPERGFGVRIEDLCYVDASGELVDLTDFHKELVLPLERRHQLSHLLKPGLRS